MEYNIGCIVVESGYRKGPFRSVVSMLAREIRSFGRSSRVPNQRGLVQGFQGFLCSRTIIRVTFPSKVFLGAILFVEIWPRWSILKKNTYT